MGGRQLKNLQQTAGQRSFDPLSDLDRLPRRNEETKLTLRLRIQGTFGNSYFLE